MYSKCVAMEAMVYIVGIPVSCRNPVPVRYTNLVTYEFDTNSSDSTDACGFVCLVSAVLLGRTQILILIPIPA